MNNKNHSQLGFSMLLADIQVGKTVRVISITLLPPYIRKKLLAMGLLPNTEIDVIRKAPMGDPLQIRIRGFDLAISKEIASKIKVAQ